MAHARRAAAIEDARQQGGEIEIKGEVIPFDDGRQPGNHQRSLREAGRLLHRIGQSPPLVAARLFPFASSLSRSGKRAPSRSALFLDKLETNGGR
jgi:hypothetical protein